MAIIKRRTSAFKCRKELTNFFIKKGYIENVDFSFIAFKLAGVNVLDVKMIGEKICEDFKELEILHPILTFCKNKKHYGFDEQEVAYGTWKELKQYVDDKIKKNKYKYFTSSSCFNYTPVIDELLNEKSA